MQETDIFNSTFAGLRFLGDPDKALLHYMLGDLSLYKVLQKKVYLFLVFQKILRKIPKYSGLCAKRILFWNAALNPIIIKNYFLFAQKARGCTRLVEKTPRHIHQTDRIFSTYKYAKILITIRHPVHAYSSHVKRAQVQKEKEWLKIDLQSFINGYRRTYLLSLNIQEDRRNRVQIISYEDFVKNPTKEFRMICKFLSEEFERHPIAEGEESLKFWNADPYLAKPITQKTKNWNDFISYKDCRYIERNLQDVMERFDYRCLC